MSRNTSKTRAEKGRATSAQPPPPVQNPEVVDIYGGLTEPEWQFMVSEQEGEEIVAAMVEELMTRVLKKCSELDIKKMLVPFSVAWAKDAMVQVIKWQYLMRDEGDEVNTVSQKDTEPQSSIIDSWAEGCVSVIRVPLPPQQKCRFDEQEANVQDAQQQQGCRTKLSLPNENTEGEKAVRKIIPAAQAKLELERKPHPPSTSKLKSSRRQFTSLSHSVLAEENQGLARLPQSQKQRQILQNKPTQRVARTSAHPLTENRK